MNPLKRKKKPQKKRVIHPRSSKAQQLRRRAQRNEQKITRMENQKISANVQTEVLDFIKAWAHKKFPTQMPKSLEYDQTLLCIQDWINRNDNQISEFLIEEAKSVGSRSRINSTKANQLLFLQKTKNNESEKFHEGGFLFPDLTCKSTFSRVLNFKPGKLGGDTLTAHSTLPKKKFVQKDTASQLASMWAEVAQYSNVGAVKKVDLDADDPLTSTQSSSWETNSTAVWE